MKEVLAVIPARGGSKRIRRKNIRPFHGVPLLQRVIQKALDAACFDRVMVSTEDEEVAELALASGAEVPFTRSSKNADDYASTEAVISEVLKSYRIRNEGKNQFESLCCLYPTAVLLPSERLREGIKILKRSEVDGVITVHRYHQPIQRALVLQETGLTWQWPEFAEMRTQDLPILYRDAGQAYFVDISVFESEKTLIPRRNRPLILEEDEFQDIDTINDWAEAERKFINQKRVSENG